MPAHKQAIDANGLEARLDRFERNRVSGAVDLALEALSIADEWIAAGRDLDELADRLAPTHPAIATVSNVATLLVSDRSGDDPAPTRIEQARRSLVEGNALIARNLKPLIAPGSTIITLSNSSTVRTAIETLGVGSVYVLESHPGGEGAHLAEQLESTGLPGLKVHLIPDAAMGNVVPEVDCALVGIDSFDRTGTILHKVGTLPLALCCRHFNKPLFAAGHSQKRVAYEIQMVPAPPEGEPQLFDHTPAGLITKLVTEEGG